MSSARVPGIVLQRPLGNFPAPHPAPPAPDSDPPQTQAGPSAQCPVGPGWLTGCHAGKLAPRGVQAGLMTSCRGRQEKLAVPLDGHSALHGEMLHRGAGVSEGRSSPTFPPFAAGRQAWSMEHLTDSGTRSRPARLKSQAIVATSVSGCLRAI